MRADNMNEIWIIRKFYVANNKMSIIYRPEVSISEPIKNHSEIFFVSEMADRFKRN